MSYCSVQDLLVGDMPINTTRAEQFVQDASDEVDMKLGTLYEWPPTGSLGPQATLILKRLNVLIGTGRLVMAQAIGAEDQATQSYGTYLLREGQLLLDQILSGDLVLLDVPKHLITSSGNAPSVVFEDSFPGVDTFYGFAMRGEDVVYRPGV